MLKTLFSLQTAIMVFEKPTTIRRPLSYATNMRDGRTRRDIASAPNPMKPYNPLFRWSLEKHPSFSLHCYTNPFESKREIIRVKNEDTGEFEERWTGDYIFENEWQSFRTKKGRALELTSVAHECVPGRRKLAVKVVDIFGNDTMMIIDVNVGAK